MALERPRTPSRLGRVAVSAAVIAAVLAAAYLARPRNNVVPLSIENRTPLVVVGSPECTEFDAWSGHTAGMRGAGLHNPTPRDVVVKTVFTVRAGNKSWTHQDESGLGPGKTLRKLTLYEQGPAHQPRRVQQIARGITACSLVLAPLGRP